MTTSLDRLDAPTLTAYKKEFGTSYGEHLFEFSKKLEDVGLFSRRYDSESLKELYEACGTLHAHLSRLDDRHLTNTEGVTLFEFVNVYAQVCLGLREF